MINFEQHKGICRCCEPYTSNLMHLNDDYNDLIVNMKIYTIYNCIRLIRICKILFVSWLRIETKEQQNYILELCITSWTKMLKLSLVLHSCTVVFKLELEYIIYIGKQNEAGSKQLILVYLMNHLSVLRNKLIICLQFNTIPVKIVMDITWSHIDKENTKYDELIQNKSTIVLETFDIDIKINNENDALYYGQIFNICYKTHGIKIIQI